MKGFLNKVQQKKVAGNASEGKPVSSAGAEGSIRVDISLPRSQRRCVCSDLKSDVIALNPQLCHCHHFISTVAMYHIRKFSMTRTITTKVQVIKELPLLSETPMLKREVRTE